MLTQKSQTCSVDVENNSPGFAPHHFLHQQCVSTSCHFVSGCGGLTKLTPSNREVIITSPDFPMSYSENVECTWLIEVGAEITLREMEKGLNFRPFRIVPAFSSVHYNAIVLLALPPQYIYNILYDSHRQLLYKLNASVAVQYKSIANDRSRAAVSSVQSFQQPLLQPTVRNNKVQNVASSAQCAVAVKKQQQQKVRERDF